MGVDSEHRERRIWFWQFISIQQFLGTRLEEDLQLSSCSTLLSCRVHTFRPFQILKSMPVHPHDIQTIFSHLLRGHRKRGGGMGRENELQRTSLHICFNLVTGTGYSFDPRAVSTVLELSQYQAGHLAYWWGSFRGSGCRWRTGVLNQTHFLKAESLVVIRKEIDGIAIEYRESSWTEDDVMAEGCLRGVKGWAKEPRTNML